MFTHWTNRWRQPQLVCGAFLISVSLLLGLTGILKIAVLIDPKILSYSSLHLQDPVVASLTNFQMVLLGIGLDIGTVVYLCSASTRISKLLLVISVASLFAAYHAALEVVGYAGPCPCLGGGVTWLPLSGETMAAMTISIVAYFLFGGYFFLSCELTSGDLVPS